MNPLGPSSQGYSQGYSATQPPPAQSPYPPPPSYGQPAGFAQQPPYTPPPQTAQPYPPPPYGSTQPPQQPYPPAGYAQQQPPYGSQQPPYGSQQPPYGSQQPPYAPPSAAGPTQPPYAQPQYSQPTGIAQPPYAPPPGYGAPPTFAPPPQAGPPGYPSAAFPPTSAAFPPTQPQPCYAMQDPPGHCLRILDAEYGFGQQVANVTRVLQSQVSNAGLRLNLFGLWLGISRTGDMNKLFGDPAPGRDKKLTFRFDVLGRVMTRIVPESDSLYIPSLHDLFKHRRIKKPSHHGLATFYLEIIEAVFEARDGSGARAVTDLVRSHVQLNGPKNHIHAFEQSGSMVASLGDVAPGRPKQLRVTYRWRTRPVQQQLEEDAKIAIDFTPFTDVLTCDHNIRPPSKAAQVLGAVAHAFANVFKSS